MPEPRYLVKRLGIVAAIALLVAIIGGALAIGSTSHGALWVSIVRGIIALVCVVILAWIVFHTTDIKAPPGPGRPRPLPPTKEEIALAYYNVVKTYDNHALKLLINMMIDRPHYLERINETVTLEDEAPQLQLATRQIFRLRKPERPLEQGADRLDPVPAPLPPVERSVAAERDQVILVPLAVLEKGTLLDGFLVTDSNGNDIPTLSYNQTRGLLAYVIRTIIIDVLPKDSKYSEDDAKVRSRVAANLVTAICSPRPMKKKDAAELQSIDILLSSISELPVADEWKRRLRDFCESLVDHYMIVAEVPLPIGSHMVLTYKQEISVDSSALSLVSRLRSRVGLRYLTYDIPLNIFSLDVEAYHMEMDAGPLQYVFDHHLERMNSKVRLTQDDLCRGASKPYVRMHYNSAGPAMHLYIRQQSDDAGASHAPRSAISGQSANYSRVRERLKSVVEFREIPPGALGASATASLMTAIIISFFALTRIGLDQTASHTPIIIGSDIPALIIALPGFASLIIGSWLDLSHLRRSSLTTYLGLASSVGLSLIGALYYLLDSNRVLPGRISLEIADNVIIKSDIG